MTPHTEITPAVTLVAQPNDKYNSGYPNLISFLMNQAMQNELETKRKQQVFHEQQKSYVSALVGKIYKKKKIYPCFSLKKKYILTFF